jgi:hypothetical protein
MTRAECDKLVPKGESKDPNLFVAQTGGEQAGRRRACVLFNRLWSTRKK